MAHQSSRTRSFRLGTLGFLCALALSVLTATPASGFGTPNKLLGQHAEHENITRAALACPPNTQSDGNCFEPDSLNQLAGRTGISGGLTPWLAPWGAVGAPDVPGGGEFLGKPAAHCDDADFLRGHYPVTRTAATARLQQCVDHLRNRFKEGFIASARLLDSGGRIKPDDVKITRPGAGVKADCPFKMKLGRAKCDALEGLGRALHGAQDFYAHSNWTDLTVKSKSKPIGPTNPPGLNRSAPSPVLDLRGKGKIKLPSYDLSTGCFSKIDRSPGVLGCKGRVTHATLNKDKGIINPATGAASGPTTPRGKVGANFARAVKGAIVETRRQWRDMRSAILARDGTERGWTIICSLTHDNPLNDCQPTYLAGTLTSKNTIDCSFPNGTSHEEIDQKADGLKLRHPAGAPDWVWDITAGSLETKVAGNSESNDNPPQRATWSAQGTQAIRTGQVQGDFPFRFEPGADDGTWAWTMEGHVVGSDSNGGSYDAYRDASAPLFDAQASGPTLHISVSYGEDGVAVGFDYSGSATDDFCTTKGSFMGQLMQVPPPSGPTVATR